MKLYAESGNLRANKVLIVAEYAGIKFDVPPFELGKDNLTEEFLLKNPIGKTPVLETDDGMIVFESNAICKYVASLKPEAGLLGTSDLQAAQIAQWVEFTTSEVEPSVLTWVGPIIGAIPFDGQLHKRAQDLIKIAFTALNRYLERNTFLVGERLTIADIILAATVLPLFQKALEPRHRTPYPNVNRWFELITQQPNFRAVWKLEPTQWCTVAQKPVQAKKEAKPEKEKKEAKPKEEKKEKPKKAEKEAEPEDEEEEVPEVVAKNPLDLLPKSSFVLDAFKREYSNNKDIKPTMQYLWENYDPEGYCMLWCTYKYNADNGALFKSTNLIGGFFQRLERFHKYAFGQMLICGEEGKHDITGFWIFRGTQLPESMNDVPDTELYEWKLIDYKGLDDAQKARITSYLNWEDIDGQTCQDGKTFK
eukprot:NODE_647_length_1460_cov_1505.178597_g487_i0.p1 GENE.NODE_647_length_1460_cov_1505.178597_g487_i0~~NODE_647_length_1460_cov_1505.178597_g487_i0.p1  ORF type:complete len:421 (+),score=114.41 NODE_647_length_1460_cov_1505.178597_g487_i0:94-1356(+)